MRSVTQAITHQATRFYCMDFVRGIAVFGILFMNMQAFSNSFASYMNPTVGGNYDGLNVVAWWLTHILFEQKFYTIFSMLFGAGILLMAETAKQKGHSPTLLHYRRNSWLLLFGLAHGFLIWYGDILTVYAICAMLIFFMRNQSAQTQIGVGLSLIALLGLLMWSSANNMPPESVAEMQKYYLPEAEILQQEINAYRGGWLENLVQRAEAYSIMLSQMLFFSLRIAGCMLIGMGLYRMGLITGQLPKALYARVAGVMLPTGLLMATYSAWLLHHSGFSDAVYNQMIIGQWNYYASLIAGIGYLALFILVYKAHQDATWVQRICKVGQMAFSNYIAQSLLCTFIFYGFGLGLFAKLERYQTLLLVPVICALLYYLSSWWLARYHYGPLEWLWRALTYGQLPPFRKKRPDNL